jgi:hypothetical protein
MRKTYYIISLFVLAITFGCADENSSVDLDSVNAPTNISALTTVTQDNTGKVTFLPKGEGVTQYEIYFGDGTVAPAIVNPGETANHVYKEGVYQSKIVGTTLNGKRTEVTQEVLVSFKAPQNLKVVITNDLSVSKKVTVTATADFALFYDVYFGEAGKPDPISANNGASVSYVYQTAGVYKIRVVSKSAAVKTTEYTKDFTVTLALKPSASAPVQPNRQMVDVISIFSSKYTNIAGTDFNPNWGQSGTYAEFDLNGDKMLNYVKISYQGIDIGSSADASAMETLHIDIWSADNMSIDIYPLPKGVKQEDERFVRKALTPNQWNSFDIPLSDFTSQGLPLNDLKQFKFVGSPSGVGTVFIDNIYFYKTPSQLLQFPIDCESSSLTYTWSGFGDANFGPIPVAVIANPEKSGVNVSNKVVKIEKPSGAQVWAGASLNLDSSVDFSKGTTVKVSVWSPKAGAKILYKMEVSTSPKDGNGNPTVFVEVQATSTVANAWEVLTFDLTSSAAFNTTNLYDRVILFPDFGANGTGSTYYFDDIKQSN